MAKKNDTAFFEKKLLDFVMTTDPMLEMLQWVMDNFMEIEVAHKTGAEKGLHAQSRTGYRCGYRIRRFDTSLGTVVSNKISSSVLDFAFITYTAGYFKTNEWLPGVLL